MVDVAQTCAGIVVELRYATPRNLTGARVYPEGARCYVRSSVAARLRAANDLLRPYGARLKIWDAYRPAWAQAILWQTKKDSQFVGNPAKGGSLHTWGVVVDATLVDQSGRELRMPTDFDAFSPAAVARYRGADPEVAQHLRLLQVAMTHAGFYAMRNEWWHWIARDYLAFGPVDMPLIPVDRTAGPGLQTGVPPPPAP